MSELAEIMDDFDGMDAPEGIDVLAERAYHEVEGRAHFTLTEPEHFDWAARKKSRATAEVKRLSEWRAQEMYKLGLAFDKRIMAAQRDEDFFDAMIRTGVESLPADPKGRRAIKTPHLTASVTHTQKWEWPESDVLVAWAYHTGPGMTLVRTKSEPDKAAMKKYIKESGDVPDGLVISEVESVRMEVLDA
jgi:hypothetical protein